MNKTLYAKMLEMFPVSPVSALSPPEKLEAGKTLTYIARIGKNEIDLIVRHCTGEDPDSKSFDPDTAKNWKSVLLRDEDGNLIKEEYEILDANKEIQIRTRNERRWEPVHFEHNRVPGMSHIKTLELRFVRVGFHHAVRTFTFDWTGKCLDGQHGFLALWRYLTDYQIPHVDISIKILGSPKDQTEGETIFRLFDQALRRRTLRDALSTVPGLPEGFEAELAGALRFSTLIASGKGINSSRLVLDHIVNEKGKPQKLEADDVAGLIGSGEPFEYYQDLLQKILSARSPIDPDEKKSETVPTLVHPNVSGPGFPNPQYYLTAFANFIFDPQNTRSYEESVALCIEFLQEIVLGINSERKEIQKLVAYKPKKALEWLSAIERMLHCFVNKVAEKDVPRIPQKLTFNGIVNHYAEWLETNEYIEPETELEEVEEFEEEPEYEEVS